MARRRVRRRRAKRSAGFSVYIVFALVGVAAVALGYFLSTFIMSNLRSTTPAVAEADAEPVEEEPASPGNPEAAGDDLDGKGEPPGPAAPVVSEDFALYGVQVGGFAHRENAQAAARQFREAGWAAAVVADGQYKVWVGLYGQRPAAQALVEQLTAQGHDSFIVQRTLAARGQLPGAQGAEELAAIVAALPALQGRLGAAWGQRALDETGWASQAAALAEEGTTLLERLAALPPAAGPPDLLAGLRQRLEETADLASGLAGLGQSAAIGEQSTDLMRAYIELVDITLQLLHNVPQP